MPIDVPLGTETEGYTVTIDGRTYRPVLVDSSGRLLLAEMTSVAVYALVDVPTAVETTLLTITGAGVCQWFQWATAHDDVLIRVFVDGSQVLEHCASWMNSEALDKTTYPVVLLVFADGSTCRGFFAGPWHFKTSFAIKAYHTTGADKQVAINRGVCSTY